MNTAVKLRLLPHWLWVFPALPMLRAVILVRWLLPVLLKIHRVQSWLATNTRPLTLGHIGTGSLMGGKESSKSISISVWKTAHSPLRKKRLPFSLPSVTNPALIRAALRWCVSAAAKWRVPALLSATTGSAIKLGDAYSENLTMNGSVAAAKQTLNFKARVKGDSAATTIDTGEFSSTVNFTISYL